MRAAIRDGQTIAPANLRLIGGEMLGWSDEQTRGVSGGRAFDPVLTAVAAPGAHVLVAGPHDRGLIRRLLGHGCKVTCLLRSHQDSLAVAGAFAGDAGLDIVCGDVAKLNPAEQFDAVIALAEMDRLVSVEAEPLPWAETFALVVAAVRPGGHLLLGVENYLGVHRLVQMSPWYADRGDAAWTPAGAADETRPAGLPHLLAHLAGAGVRVDQVYAGYADPAAPTVLVSRAAVGAFATDGPLAGVLAAACAGSLVGQPVLSDPRRLAVAGLRGGLAAELASSWVALCRREPDPTFAATVGPPQPGLPEIVVADPAPGTRSALVYEVSPDPGGGWLRRLVTPGSPVDGAAARRDPARVVGPMPAGRLLEEILIEACLHRDLPRLRHLLGGYAAWLTALADPDGEVPGDYAFATPANLLRDGDRFTPLDPSWIARQPQPMEVLLIRAVRQFAVTLIGGGYSHPWPSTMDADGLAVILASMAGCAVERDAVARAVRLEIELEAAVRGLTGERRDALAARLIAVDATSPPVDIDSHRELREASVRLRQELRHERAKLLWYEEMLTSRETALKQARRTIDRMSGSLSYRVGRFLMMPLRLAKRAARGVVRRATRRLGRPEEAR